MKIVKCLSAVSLIIKVSIPSKTLHGFTFLNYESDGYSF